MPRTFAYLRVSTMDQTTDNQLGEIVAAGFQVEAQRVIAETISGSSAMAQRKGFTRLLDKLERDDVLIVTKLDRLGRDVLDVVGTVRKLDAMGVRVHCLALGGVDLTSSSGKMTLSILSAVAEFERDLIVERTQAGLKRAKADGKVIGRRAILTADQRAEVRKLVTQGASVSALAQRFKTSRQTINRARAEAV